MTKGLCTQREKVNHSAEGGQSGLRVYVAGTVIKTLSFGGRKNLV